MLRSSKRGRERTDVLVTSQVTDPGQGCIVFVAWRARALYLSRCALRRSRDGEGMGREGKGGQFTSTVSISRDVSKCFHAILPVVADTFTGGLQ